MDRAEMRGILEEIARESANPNARVSAIRALRQLAEAEEEEKPEGSAFDELDKAAGRTPWAELYQARPKGLAKADELMARRKGRKRA
jgi:hypothetical protein